jgi:hypothetical protein
MPRSVGEIPVLGRTEHNLRVLFLAAAGLALAAPAFAQNAGELGKALAKGVSCASAASAKTNLDDNVGASKASTSDIITSLGQIASDTNTCQPLRDAARDKSNELSASMASQDQDRLKAASRAVVDAALAEADQKVANLEFEVGPPPRNLTRRREAPSRP